MVWRSRRRWTWHEVWMGWDAIDRCDRRKNDLLMADVDVYYQFDLRGLTLREILRSEPKFKCLPRSDENVERYRETYTRSTMLKRPSLVVPKAALASPKLRVVLNDGNTKTTVQIRNLVFDYLVINSCPTQAFNNKASYFSGPIYIWLCARLIWSWSWSWP